MCFLGNLCVGVCGAVLSLAHSRSKSGKKPFLHFEEGILLRTPPLIHKHRATLGPGPGMEWGGCSLTLDQRTGTDSTPLYRGRILGVVGSFGWGGRVVHLVWPPSLAEMPDTTTQH